MLHGAKRYSVSLREANRSVSDQLEDPVTAFSSGRSSTHFGAAILKKPLSNVSDISGSLARSAIRTHMCGAPVKGSVTTFKDVTAVLPRQYRIGFVEWLTKIRGDRHPRWHPAIHALHRLELHTAALMRVREGTSQE